MFYFYELMKYQYEHETRSTVYFKRQKYKREGYNFTTKLILAMLEMRLNAYFKMKNDSMLDSTFNEPSDSFTPVWMDSNR